MVLSRPLVTFSIWTLATVVLLWMLPYAVDFRLLSLATSWLIFAGLVYGVDLVHGTLNFLSLAHIALWAIAAYGMFIFEAGFGINFWVAAGLTIPICIVVAIAIASFAFRTAGYYFAILTFVVAELIRLGFTNNVRGLTGGSEGLFFFARPTIFGFQLIDPGVFFRFSLICLAATLVFTYAVRASDFGWKCSAVGESRDLAEALGIDTYRTKVIVFALSAIPAAVSGILYGMFSGAINPDLFGPDAGIGTILSAILGGTGTMAGPLIGAAIFIIGPSVVPFGPNIAQGALGLLFILTIRFSPVGISPRIMQLGSALWRRIATKPSAALRVEPGRSSSRRNRS